MGTDNGATNGRLLVYIGDEFLGRLKAQAKAGDMTLSDCVRALVAKHFGEKYEPHKKGEKKARLTVTATEDTVASLKTAAETAGMSLGDYLAKLATPTVKATAKAPAKGAVVTPIAAGRRKVVAAPAAAKGRRAAST